MCVNTSFYEDCIVNRPKIYYPISTSIYDYKHVNLISFGCTKLSFIILISSQSWYLDSVRITVTIVCGIRISRDRNLPLTGTQV